MAPGFSPAPKTRRAAPRACRRLRPSDAAAACMPIDFEGYAWLVVHPERLADPVHPTGRPQPEFFMPFVSPPWAHPI